MSPASPSRRTWAGSSPAWCWCAPFATAAASSCASAPSETRAARSAPVRADGAVGHPDAEGRAVPGAAVDLDRAAELGHQPPHDVEAEPDPAAVIARLAKRLEDHRQEL